MCTNNMHVQVYYTVKKLSTLKRKKSVKLSRLNTSYSPTRAFFCLLACRCAPSGNISNFKVMWCQITLPYKTVYSVGSKSGSPRLSARCTCKSTSITSSNQEDVLQTTHFVFWSCVLFRYVKLNCIKMKKKMLLSRLQIFIRLHGFVILL